MLLKFNGIGRTSQNSEEWYLVTRSSAVAGGDLRAGGASVGRDTNTNAPDVNFTLTNEGGRKFAAFTGAHVNDRLAVVLDNKVREVATINEQIHDQGRSEEHTSELQS